MKRHTGTKRPEATEADHATLKQTRLQHTVEYAYDHSPFYRELMQANGLTPTDAQTTDDLTQLPIVEPSDVLANQPPVTDQFRFKATDAQIRRPFHTSGTTGQPKTIFKSHDEMDRIYDDVQRGFEHFGVTPTDVVVNYCPFVGLNISCMGTEGGLARLGCTTVPIANTPYPVDREAEILQEHQPSVVHGLASHIDAKGHQLRDAGYDPAASDIDLVVVVGEPVSESRKERLGDLYDAEVVEYVGSTEAGAFAFECPEDGFLHVLDTSVHVEVVDDDGAPLPAGEQGRLVVTNLLNPISESGMPLLRYAIGDVVSIVEDANPCSCPLDSDCKITPPRRSGWQFILGAVNLTTQTFEDVIYSHPELKAVAADYQVHVEHDPTTGQEVATLLIESVDEGLVGQVVDDMAAVTTPMTTAETLGTMLLERNSHLTEVVENTEVVRLAIQIVDNIDTGDGKPQQLVDQRGVGGA
ncbi:phenylacetate--CoA ligase family protein [Halobacterium zhouii]|uniref:phenylacetate--CoA ligase family protein n=1 Tax=Halobacterium zhouii TaxID=2902624 RepID=UPI001E623448|nr:AMP-binding protein [Halobacterium zhouii]